MAESKKKKRSLVDLPTVERPASFADLGLPDPNDKVYSPAEPVVSALGPYREAQGKAQETALRALAMRDLGAPMPTVIGQGNGGGILTAASAIANALMAKRQLAEAGTAASAAGAVPGAGYRLEAADIRNNPNYFFGSQPYRVYQRLKAPQQPVVQGTPMSAPFSFGGELP